MENQQASWEDTPEEQEVFNRPNFDEIKKMSIVVGENKVSLLGNPFFYKRHWISSKKRSANCPGEGCPLCGAGELPSGRYAVNVYHHKDKLVEILEFGRGLKNDIATIIRLWGGNLNAFDLIITRVGKTKEDTKYTPVAIPRVEKIPTDLKLYELPKVYKPTPIDAIIKILEGKEEKKEEKTAPDTTGTGTGIKTSTAPVESAPVETTSVEKKEEETVILEEDNSEINLDQLIEDDK